jgi:ABC-type phosphate transport system substrate-binding protein
MVWRVMQDRPFGQQMRTDRIVVGMAGPMSAMAMDPFAISYSVHYYVRYMSPYFSSGGMRQLTDPSPFDLERDPEMTQIRAVPISPRSKLLAIDGVVPSPATIADGSYPLIEPVYLVTRRHLDPSSPAAILREWLLSGPGQQTIARSGYVPLSDP